ncbi:glycosyltransferase family 61 protein [Acidisoma sp.]|uniref:glycosyltransferase family 61 protein n=1 Tax=Acidisoma sp. TaxID=1872115 RepID=UPI003B002BA8
MDLPQPDDQASTAAGAAEPPAAAPAPAAPQEQPDGNMLAHISMRGNVMGRAGAWVGEPGSGLAIEALLLAPAAPGPPQLSPAPECQLIYQHGLKTPWMAGGAPAGSSGFALACRGIRFRLSPETAAFFDCRYDIAFTDGTRQDDVPGATVALSPSGAAVEAIRLHIIQRAPTPLVVLNDLSAEPAPGESDTLGPDPTVRLRLLSPAFATRKPDIRNAASIPAGSWESMAVSFNRRVFGGRNVTFRVIDDAIVAGEGIVFDHDLNLVSGTSRLMDDDAVQRFREMAQATPLRRIAGLSVLCKTANPNNYGHFLMEMFPKAWLTSQLLSDRPATYIVHQTNILKVTQDALTGIGINPFAISVTDHVPVRCAQLIVIDGLTSHGIYQSPICAQALTELAASVPPAPYPKVFVSRHSRDRPLLNQEAAETALRDRGFAIVDPAVMTLTEQISLFKGASTVVGPLGAALTNIAFCPRGSKIVALTSQSFPDTFFWFLSQHRDHDYSEVRCQNAAGNPDEVGSWHAGFTLADEDLAFLATL